MALQLSTSLRNNMLDQIESTVGTSAILEIRSGSQPSTCASADVGTLLVSYSLASDWATAADSGAKSLSNVPLGSTAVGAGAAGHWRLKDSAGTVCHAQGTVSTTGGGGDLIIDNATIGVGQTVNITSLTFVQGGD